MHAGDRAIHLHAGLEPHQHRMPAAMAVEHLFSREADLHRSIEEEGGLGDDHLVIERVALAAEAAAVGCRDDADVRGRHGQRLRERPVHVVRRLCARPEHELAVGILCGDRCVLLDRQVGVALIEEGVLEYAIRIGERLLDVAEAQRHGLVNVAGVAVLVNARFGVCKAFLRIGKRAERLVFHVDIVERFERRQLVARDDGGDRIADEADAIHRERVLVLADGKNAVRDREVPPGQNQQHARTRERA